jgi:hypothetical protein
MRVAKHPRPSLHDHGVILSRTCRDSGRCQQALVVGAGYRA